MSDPECLVSLQSAARCLDVCVRTIYRIIDQGDLPKPIKVRGCSRLPISAINSYLSKLGVSNQQTH